MPRHLSIGAAALAAAAVGWAGVAVAEPWVDWSPAKTWSERTYVHVDPGHMDDYLTGLRKTWIPDQAYRKAHGDILGYAVGVSFADHTSGPNVVLVVTYPNMASQDPDKQKDLAEREYMLKQLPDADRKAKVAEYQTYRKQLAVEAWRDVDFSK